MVSRVSAVGPGSCAGLSPPPQGGFGLPAGWGRLTAPLTFPNQSCKSRFCQVDCHLVFYPEEMNSLEKLLCGCFQKQFAQTRGRRLRIRGVE